LIEGLSSESNDVDGDVLSQNAKREAEIFDQEGFLVNDDNESSEHCSPVESEFLKFGQDASGDDSINEVEEQVLLQGFADNVFVSSNFVEEQHIHQEYNNMQRLESPHVAFESNHNLVEYIMPGDVPNLEDDEVEEDD
jgi:hypothetical protein